MQPCKKACQALQCSTDQLKITLDPSISHSPKDIPVGLDSFVGNVRSFRLYLKAQRTLLTAGVIAP